GDRVAFRMRRSDLEELYLFAPDMQRERAVERAVRRRQGDTGEIEIAHHLVRESGAFAEHPVIRHHPGEHLGPRAVDLRRAMLGRDYRRRAGELVAEKMIGIDRKSTRLNS